MSFRADDVETAESDHLLVLSLDDAFGASEDCAPLLVGCFVGIDLVLFKKLARHEIRIAAQQDVSAATRHVGGDSDRAFASGLSDDFRFALMVFGVQDVVRHGLS